MEIIFIATILAPAVVLVLFASFFVAIGIVKYTQFRKKNQQRSDKRLEASAIVLNVEPTGWGNDDHTKVRLQMQVLPEKGRNFVAEVKEVFTSDDFSRIYCGCTVKVKYNPSNLRQVILVKAA